jgi:TRAP-type C4-dicarboxylate transport system substrate-binding protein
MRRVKDSGYDVRVPRLPLGLLLSILLVAPAGAAPIQLRIAAIAPEGSAWAHVMHAFSNEVSALTSAQLQLKWVLGGIAGDEFSELERMRKGQLDGAGLVIGCEELAPTLHALRVVGLLQSREEARFVMAHLWPQIEQEFQRAGFVGFGVANLGTIVVFSRQPVRNFDELRNTRLWVLDRDTIWIRMLRDLGLQPVPVAVDQAARAFEERRVDGFLSVPGAALMYQWSPLTPYYTDLRVGMLPVCFVLTQRSYDTLSVEQRQALAAGAARFGERFEEEGRKLDDALLGKLLAKQGLHRIKAEASFVREFLQASQSVREKIDPALVKPELLSKVLSLLADFRAERDAVRK